MTATKRITRGFSLLEVLVASTLLILSITGVVNASAAMLRNREHQVKASQGMQIAESLMEQLLLTYTTHPDLSGGPHVKNYDRTGRDLGGTAGFYRADYQVLGLGGAQTGMRRLDLLVSWMEGNRRRSIRLVTDR